VSAAGNPGYIDYFYNRDLSYKSLSDLTQPSLTIAFGDGMSGAAGQRTYGCDYARDAGGGTNVGCPAGGLSKLPTKRHLDGSNFTFCDGHVKWYPASNQLNDCGNGLGSNCWGFPNIYNGTSTFTATLNNPTFNADTQ
jgi:prepilin-type processing-associated H-X9-DG protein